MGRVCISEILWFETGGFSSGENAVVMVSVQDVVCKSGKGEAVYGLLVNGYK